MTRLKGPSTRVFARVLGAALLALLVACSDNFRATSYNFDVGIDPNPFGFDVDVTEQGIEYIIPAHNFSFASRAGAMGVTVEGYDIEFYEASNSPAFPGDFVQRSSGSLNVYVPPGLTCDELREPDAEPAFDYCTVNSPGATFARGPERTSPPSYVLPLDIAIQLYDLVGVGGAVGAYAHVYFYGTDDLQRPFRTETPYRFAIQLPVGEGGGG